MLKDLNLWRVNVSIFLLHYLLVSAFSVLPLLFEASGRIETDEHALYYLVLLLVSFVAMLPLMRLSDRLKDNRGVLAGTVGLSVLAFGVLVSLHGYWWLLGPSAASFLCSPAFGAWKLALAMAFECRMRRGTSWSRAWP